MKEEVLNNDPIRINDLYRRNIQTAGSQREHAVYNTAIRNFPDSLNLNIPSSSKSKSKTKKIVAKRQVLDELGNPIPGTIQDEIIESPHEFLNPLNVKNKFYINQNLKNEKPENWQLLKLSKSSKETESS